MAICNYCKNVVSVNKLHQCHECNRFYHNALKTKLKINGEFVIKNKEDLEKTLNKNFYCESCITKIRKNKFLCPNCLIKFCNNEVIMFIEK